MKQRYQKGDVGAAMLVMMVVVMLGAPSVERTEKTAQELLDEAYARGQITRAEYLRKRADLAPTLSDLSTSVETHEPLSGQIASMKRPMANLMMTRINQFMPRIVFASGAHVDGRRYGH